MVPEPHGCLYIEIYFLIILFQVTIYLQYVHDYFNGHLRCCVLCHYYMLYGRLRFYCIFIVYTKFFMFTLFLLYLVRNDNNKDDQSINQSIKIMCHKGPVSGPRVKVSVELVRPSSLLYFVVVVVMGPPL